MLSSSPQITAVSLRLQHVTWKLLLSNLFFSSKPAVVPTVGRVCCGEVTEVDVPSSFPNGVCRPPPLFQTRQRWRRQVRKRRLAGDFCFSPLIRPQPRVKLSGDLLVIKLNVTKLAEPKDRWSKQVQHDWQLVRGTPACSRSHAVQRRGLISPDGGAGLCGSSQWERHECILKSRIKQHALAPLTLTIFTVKGCKQSRPFFLKLIMRWLCGACGEVVHFLWGGGGGGFRRKEPH